MDLGVLARQHRLAITLLTRGWSRFDDLVRETGLPRRSVEELLAELGEDVERSGSALRLRPDSAERWADHVGCPATPPPDLEARIAEHLADVPPPLPALDHVQATADTVLRRALWLDEHYDLGRVKIVFVGDHDLTSLAVHELRADADLAVVDLDDRVLAHIDRRSEGTIRTVHADLRFGLPRAVSGTADIVFSDPPYTPEGMALFASRAVECLSEPVRGRVLLAYGYSRRHPTLGHQTQKALLNLGLAFEAIVPGFNRYHGAQAIGSTADLYVCQPTPRARRKTKNPQAIYTHGPSSVEAGKTTESREALAAFTALAGEGGRTVTVAGPDWTKPATAEQGTAVALDLTGDPGPWLCRALLAVNAERVAALVPNAHPDLADAASQTALIELVAPKYKLRLLRSTPDNKHAVVVADRVETVSAASQVWTRAHARLGNVWPDAPAGLADLRLIDLPRHRIVEVLRLLTANRSISD
ncbi:bis-aminopropyl spermidine synthase family protein [Saccharomonospora xinjiangensis]|uniref:Putative methyltransferase n=1 Tax=Saccharomonospora xinjiangensis XJ-54 TaxID=882086 RepID=I0V599_9PSEU|nr:bis-aminopropyl spermidine synthase family protein [Saccharomonospora xinjiangensis]EID55302.1 putative methyltransferase [Saccharomonospora xinjiangensis XJ-54]